MIDKKESWISLDQAVEYLGIGKTKLYDLAQSGRIPAQKIDKQWKMKTSDLDRWVATSKSIQDYFTSVKFNIENNEGLREPQKEAYKKVYDYFKSGGKEALVQMPVGCGKTGLATILPFGIAKGRVLVVAPNLTIRDELHNNLDVTHRKCFWKRSNVLDDVDMISGPFVTNLKTGNISVSDTSHFVVTNVQQLTTNTEKWLNRFSSDYFDMIIVDEAHHAPADSWKKIIDHFPNAKVINLTATPFRGDAKEVPGDKVYRYPFRSAVAKGYIKRLAAVYVAPSEVIISFKGEDKKYTYSLDDVLGMKEKEWFSRGIAMADECNKSIVDASIQQLETLRSDSSIKHQVIAVAMSIHHAEEICLLYESRNYEAAVIHSKMNEEEQQTIIKRLRSNDLDVIVNVQMLGEGFDHPQLSIAAIFTPYRSLKPYLQFIGRIMRVNKQNAPRDFDNYGYIVSHVGMNLDTLVDQFKLFERDDQEFWSEIAGGIPPEPPLTQGEGIGKRRSLSAPLTVHGQIVDELTQETFLEEDDSVRLAELKEMLEASGFDASKAEEILKQQPKDGAKVVQARKMIVQPQKELERLRKQLDIEVRVKAKAVLANARLSVVGQEIPRKLLPDLNAVNNLIAVIMMLNRELKQKTRDADRNDWSQDEYRNALEILPGLAAHLVRKLMAAKRAKNEKR